MFQLDGEERQSASELTTPRVKPPHDQRAYLIAIVALLFGVVAVLAFLVLI